jgi:hypothetical protein
MEARNDRLFEPAPKRRTDAVQPRQHELLVEVLRFVTAALAFGSVTLGIFGRFHWFSNPRVIGTAGAAGVTFLLWLAIPRFRTWAKHRNARSRDLEFVASQGKRLHKLLGHFKAFAHSTENESLVSILRSACVDESLVRQLYGAEYVSTWFDCLYEESELEAVSLRAFLNRCTQFVALMTEFNTCHVIPTQKQIEKGTFSVPDHFIDELEQFREDYNAFQRDVEEWTNELRDYSRLGWGEGDWWRKHSPAVHFERVRSFRPPKPVGVHLP